jgi:hypothetical protein
MPQPVTKLYAKKIYKEMLDGAEPPRIMSLLEDFFAKRVDEFESQLDTIAGEPAINISEVKLRSGKTNMKVPQ